MEEINEFNENTDWKEIIKLIEANQFSKFYPNYKLKIKEKGYLISNKEKNIYLFDEKKEIKIFFNDNNLPETLEIYSSLEIENKIKKKGNDIENLYVKGKNYKYSRILASLECYIDIYDFEIRKVKKLDKLEFVKNLSKNEDYTPGEYSKFFQYYFIFLDQFNKRGKTLDFAYLYGKKTEKTFIGFQMKCYFDKSDLSDDAVNKCKIRKNCQKILINSMKLFNCKITKWCYYLVFYYNHKYEDENIKQTNLTKCERNNVSYFLYEPIEKKFYCVSQGVKIPMEELDNDNDKNADLDSCLINAISFSKNIFEELKIKIGKKEVFEMQQSFINDFGNDKLECKEKKKIYFLLDNIRNNLVLKNCKLFLHAKCKFSNKYFFPPDEDYIFLYKKKKSKSFIASYIKKNVNIFIDLSTKKQLKTIFDCLDVECDYYYCLKKIKYKQIFGNSTFIHKKINI